MFYQYPQDSRTYDITEQFMIGDAIMVSPVMSQVDDSDGVIVTVYFPAGTWYDYYTGQFLLQTRQGKSLDLKTPVSRSNIYVKDSAAFATQVSHLCRSSYWFYLRAGKHGRASRKKQNWAN